MKKAFTLIEVMIAVIIVFITVDAVMNVVGNNKQLIHIFLENKNFALKSSVAFLEKKEMKNNYERLIDFNITNDKIIHTLKKDEIKVEEDEDLKQDYNISNSAISEIINRVKAYDKTHSTTIYSIGIQ